MESSSSHVGTNEDDDDDEAEASRLHRTEGTMRASARPRAEARADALGERLRRAQVHARRGHSGALHLQPRREAGLGKTDHLRIDKGIKVSIFYLTMCPKRGHDAFGLQCKSYDTN